MFMYYWSETGVCILGPLNIFLNSYISNDTKKSTQVTYRALVRHVEEGRSVSQPDYELDPTPLLAQCRLTLG